MVQIILTVIIQHVQDYQVIPWPRKHGFMKGRSYLTKLILYDRVTCIVDQEMAVYNLPRLLSKVFDPAPHSFLQEKLAAWTGVLFTG